MRLPLDAIAAAVAGQGFITRGGFHPASEDRVPGEPGSVVLVGNAGPAMWRAFQAAVPAPAGANPLDTWTRGVLGAVAEQLGAGVLFPFDGPPYWPFQRWAQRAEAVFPSPIGPLVHPVYGLWHAYRAAFLFAERLDLPVRPQGRNPCETCAEKPCLTTCPVGALASGAYNVPGCVAHLDTPAGADCLGFGCRARRACPVGADSPYATQQVAFHMAHFRATNRERGR